LKHYVITFGCDWLIYYTCSLCSWGGGTKSGLKTEKLDTFTTSYVFDL